VALVLKRAGSQLTERPLKLLTFLCAIYVCLTFPHPFLMFLD
jgi:hypothetical protein